MPESHLPALSYCVICDNVESVGIDGLGNAGTLVPQKADKDSGIKGIEESDGRESGKS